MATETTTPDQGTTTSSPKAGAPDKLPDISQDPLYRSLVEQSMSAVKDYATRLGKQGELEQANLAKREGLIKPALEQVRSAATIQTPPRPSFAPEPERPSVTLTPFMNVKPNAETASALQTLVGGLSNIVLAFGGMSSPIAALNSLSGAMDGWAEGNMIKAQREWRDYEAKLGAMQRHNQQALKEWELARVQRADDQEAAKVLLEANLAEAGLGDYAEQVGSRGLERAGQLWQMTNQQLQQWQTTQNAVVRQQLEMLRLQETVAEHGRLDLHRAAQERNWTETRKNLQDYRKEKLVDDRRKIEDTFLKWQTAEDRLRDSQRQLETYRADRLKFDQNKFNEMVRAHKELEKDRDLTRDALVQHRRMVANDSTSVKKMRLNTQQRLLSLGQALRDTDRLEEDLKIADKQGYLPKGRNPVQLAMAELHRNLANTGEMSAIIGAIQRFGTSQTIRAELEMMGGTGASIMRLKSIGEAEAKGLMNEPKEFWDMLIGRTREALSAQQKLYQHVEQDLQPIDAELQRLQEEEQAPALQWETVNP